MDALKYCSILFILFLTNSIYSENKVSLKKEESCSIEKAEAAVRDLPEVIESQSYIESLTNKEHGVAIMADSELIDGTPYYTFQVGFNGSDRFETYYFFYVNKANCTDIKVLEIVSGELKSLKEWRKLTR